MYFLLELLTEVQYLYTIFSVTQVQYLLMDRLALEKLLQWKVRDLDHVGSLITIQ